MFKLERRISQLFVSRRDVRAMKKHLVFIIPLLTTLLLTGCTRHHSQTIVATIDDRPITLQEYESTFARLSGGWERGEQASIEERQEFLDLLVKFKMKVRDAYDSGLHHEQHIQNELDEYRKSLSAAFLIERELVEPALREMYTRRAEELRASHILLRLPRNPEPDDTILAYQKALEAIEKIEQGTPFAEVALLYSEDPGVQNNMGDLQYFSGGMMVKPFEDAAYRLEVGEFTREPVRTQFGYHIIKVTDRKPATGSIRVSHIMTFARPGMAPEDTLNAYNKIREVRDIIIETGADFGDIAQEYSEDRQSAERGGDLGSIRRRSLPPDFENVAFSMEPGEISDIVRTEYGFHIIKVTNREPIPSYEEMKDNLRQQYQQQYMQEDHKNFIASLSEKYRLNRHDQNIETFIAAVDTQWFVETPAWFDSLDASIADQPLFTIAGDTISAKRAARQIQNNPEFAGRRLMPDQLRHMLNRVEEIELIHKEAENIEERYPEFSGQIDEYRDGILIYFIEQKRVWDNIDLSEDQLTEFYQDNQELFTFPDRVQICEIVVRSDSLAQELYEKIIAGENMEELAAVHTLRSGMRRQGGVTGMINADRDQLAKRGFEQEIGEVSEPFRFGNNFAIVKTLDRDPSRMKTFEEARAQVTGEYQDMMAKKLEQEWMETLRQRYRVQTFPHKLQQAFSTEDT